MYSSTSFLSDLCFREIDLFDQFRRSSNEAHRSFKPKSKLLFLSLWGAPREGPRCPEVPGCFPGALPGWPSPPPRAGRAHGAAPGCARQPGASSGSAIPSEVMRPKKMSVFKLFQLDCIMLYGDILNILFHLCTLNVDVLDNFEVLQTNSIKTLLVISFKEL